MSVFRNIAQPLRDFNVFLRKLNGICVCQTGDELYCCPLLNMTFTIFCATPDKQISRSMINATVHFSHNRAHAVFLFLGFGPEKENDL